MAKVKETRMFRRGGLGGDLQEKKEVRVRKLDKDEEPPKGAVSVPENTPEHDWETEE